MTRGGSLVSERGWISDDQELKEDNVRPIGLEYRKENGAAKKSRAIIKCFGGWYWVRTSDPCCVRAVLYR